MTKLNDKMIKKIKDNGLLKSALTLDNQSKAIKILRSYGLDINGFWMDGDSSYQLCKNPDGEFFILDVESQECHYLDIIL